MNKYEHAKIPIHLLWKVDLWQNKFAIDAQQDIEF